MSHDELLDFATPVMPAVVENDYSDDDDEDDEWEIEHEVIGMSYDYNNAYYFY